MKPIGDVKVFVIYLSFFSKLQLISLSLKIFSEKPLFEAAPKIDAKNEKYVKPGGDVKVRIKRLRKFYIYQFFQLVSSLFNANFNLSLCFLTLSDL